MLTFTIKVDELINTIPEGAQRDQVLMLMDSQYWRGRNDERKDRSAERRAFYLVAGIAGWGLGGLTFVLLHVAGVIAA